MRNPRVVWVGVLLAALAQIDGDLMSGGGLELLRFGSAGGNVTSAPGFEYVPGFARVETDRLQPLARQIGSARIPPVFFEICGPIAEVETFAAGTSIRALPRLRKLYGKGRWRKRKGTAAVKLPNGTIRKAEIHWYEASGIGKKELKIKRFVD